MSFSIEEYMLKSKSVDETACEDLIFVSDNFIAVIDGATSKSNITFESKSTGRKASEIIANSLRLFSNDITSENAISLLTKGISDFYEQNSLLNHMEENPVDRLSASIAIFSAVRKEVWMIGDCQVMIDGTIHTNEKEVDHILANMRSLCLEASIIQGNTIECLLNNDIGRECIKPMLIQQSQFQNQNFKSQYSYATIDGFPVHKKGVKVLPVVGESLILASDGYPKLFSTLHESENYLRFILKEDPLCYKLYKSTKGLKKGAVSFDDRAFIKARLKN